jgi:ferric-dicitrate binding protein FerR (iron transport regulator)
MNAYDRFVRELREPVSRSQIERSTARVLESLEAGEPARLGPVPVPRRPSRRSWEWSAVAAASLAFIVAGVLQVALLQPVGSDVLARTPNGRFYRHGESILSRNDAMNLTLTDGSRLEMSANAGLSIMKTADGMRIVLSEGHLIVTAAKQHGGRLYVETKDCEVSVVGTVFSVHASPSGSRVSVVEGEVRVRHGEKVQTLLPGQQVSTGAIAAPVSVKADIAWSSEAQELVALLQQATPAAVVAVPENQPGTVKGTVLREGSSESIADVVLSICPDPQPIALSSAFQSGGVVFGQLFGGDRCASPLSTTTDGAGRFVFRDLSAGRYTIRARKDGYLSPLEASLPAATPTTSGNNDIIYFLTTATQNLEVWTLEGGPLIAMQRVTVDTEPRAAEVTVSLVGAGKLSGKVRNSDGKFAPYVPVQLGIVSRTAGSPSFRKLTSVNTNGSGEYRFRVPPGDYLIFSGNLPAMANEPKEFPMPGDALRISVKEGEEVTPDILIYREPSPWR